MNKASEVAAELRRVADGLDAVPELEISSFLSISPFKDDKSTFVALAKAMPKPLKKGVDFEGKPFADFTLSHAFWKIKISQSEVCKIVEPARPAKYECPPIFTPEEEAEMGNEQGMTNEAASRYGKE